MANTTKQQTHDRQAHDTGAHKTGSVDNELLAELMAQHRRVEKMLQQLGEAHSADEQKPLVEKLTTALTEHMAIEERNVYPTLRSLDAEMGEEAFTEHALVRDGLETLAGLIGEAGFGAAVAMLEAGIEHHVEEEEREAFPLLRQKGGARGESGKATSIDLTDRTKQELYEMAQEADIDGRSSMTRAELVDALSKQQSRVRR